MPGARYAALLGRVDGTRSLGVSLGLERTRAALDRLGNPERRVQAVQIAGTNGKGSVAAMTAEPLRRAAALMRERAEAATPGPWFPWDGWGPTEDGLMGFSRLGPRSGERVLHHDDMRDIYATRADVEHIATMHPAVALAVADWLDAYAERLEVLGHAIGSNHGQALAVARAYLGEA